MEDEEHGAAPGGGPAGEPPSGPAAAPQPPAAPPGPHEPTAREGRRDTFQPLLYAKIAALLFFIAYATAFVVGNRRSISIDFVFATTNVSLIWTILLLLAVGIVGGVLVSQLYRHRRRQQRRKQADPVPDLGRRDEAEGKAGRVPPA